MIGKRTTKIRKFHGRKHLYSKDVHRVCITVRETCCKLVGCVRQSPSG